MSNDALLEILSEAAVVIANLDSPENPVAKRVRRAMQEIRDPDYWDKRVAAVKLDLAKEIKQVANELNDLAAGRLPRRRGEEVCD